MVEKTSLGSASPVLLVDDEPHILLSFEAMLHSGGISDTICCHDGRKVMPLLENQKISVALLDLSMPYVSGQELLQLVTERHPDIPVIVVTGANDLRTAIDCMKAGAYDYLVKPPDEEQLLASVRRAIETNRLRAENEALKAGLLSDDLQHPECFSAIISRSPSMLALFRYIEAVAATGQPILIAGETGVGKELFARAIHDTSRLKGAFVAVNAAGLDDQAFADTLFGHKKGAFTGADERRDGLIKQAAGGTLFLDEIGDVPSSSQVKLLRLLQEREYLPLGSDVAQLSNARIVASTHRNLGALMSQEKFRADLYYRFRTHQIVVPPLRERKEDIPLLLDHFLESAAKQLQKSKPTPPAELVSMLATYDYPGNIRELEAMVVDAVSNHQSGVLSMSTFESTISAENTARGRGQSASSHIEKDSPYARLRVLPSLKEASDQLVAEAMRRSKGNQSLAARLLGVSQSALSQRLKKQVKGATPSSKGNKISNIN